MKSVTMWQRADGSHWTTGHQGNVQFNVPPCKYLSYLLNTLICLSTDKVRNATSSPRNKKSRVRNSSWLVFLNNLQYKQAYIHRSMWNAFKSRHWMLSHWHAFSTVEVTIQLFAGPQTILFSSSTCSKQKIGEPETVNRGINRRLASSL